MIYLNTMQRNGGGQMSSDGWDIMRQVWLDWLEENKVEIEDE